MELMVLIHDAQENWYWLNYDPWLTIIGLHGIIDSAALFRGFRKTTYTEVYEIGVAFL